MGCSESSMGTSNFAWLISQPDHSSSGAGASACSCPLTDLGLPEAPSNDARGPLSLVLHEILSIRCSRVSVRAISPRMQRFFLRSKSWQGTSTSTPYPAYGLHQ